MRIQQKQTRNNSQHVPDNHWCNFFTFLNQGHFAYIWTESDA